MNLPGDDWRLATIAARDGESLAATLFSAPQAEGPVVVIAGAIGVKQSYYQHFARFLAAQGARALTFDYRGIGASRAFGTPRGGLRIWGECDLAGVLDYALELGAGAPLRVVAHSVGGQLIGFADNNHRIDAMLAVSAQIGAWRLWPAPRKYALCLFWRLFVPAATAALGYFPAKRLGLGEDLPRDAALEWARWCDHPDYFVDDAGERLPLRFDAFAGAIRAACIDDDWMAPQASVDALTQRYSHAPIEPWRICAEGTPIGHFGFFRERGRPFWNESARWLLER
jgi:predicted alpha/beta hydrolase